MVGRLRAAGLAGLGLFLVLVAPSIAEADNCGSLLASIDQLKAQIPREPRDAAADDRQVLDNYVGLYNRACIGGGSSPGGGYGGVPRGNNNLSNGLGAAADALNALSDLADELDRQQQEEDAARQQQEEQEEMDAALEQAQHDAAERAAEAQERAAEAAARSADDAQRQAMANPFAGSSASGGAANPFAGKSRGANPFGTTASPGAAPKATAPAKNASSGASSRATGTSGFKSDAQIAADCAKSGSPSVCRATETAARAQSPAYQKYAAEQKQQIQKNVDDAQKHVDEEFAKWDRQKAQRPPPDQLGALPKILAGIPPDNDEGDECGPRGYGRRHGGQCMFPWTQSPEACAAANGSYYPADDDHPTAFCGTGAPANPMTAYPGPNEGAQCGDVAGHIHGGACWALGITRDDCQDQLHGVTLDNGGLQYCAYDADAVAQEQTAAADVLKRQSDLDDLRKKLAKLLAGEEEGTPGGGGTTNPIVPITAKPGDTDAPPPAKQDWTPDYECRLADGTVFHTDDPTKIGGEDPNDGTQGNGVGFDPLHKWDCHLMNGRPIIGLTPNSPDK